MLTPNTQARIDALREQAIRLEMKLARCGDAYLKSVLRADITTLRKQIKELQNS